MTATLGPPSGGPTLDVGVALGSGAVITFLLLPHAGRHNKNKGMSQNRVIVAAVDLHKGSNLVTKRALEMAGRGGTVHVICVSEPNIANVKPPEDLDAPELTGVDPHRLKGLLDARVADYKKGHPETELPKVELHTDAGDPAEKIVALAARVDADAIIVSSHGRTGIRRLIIGSVAEKVVRLAGCTVIVAREKKHDKG